MEVAISEASARLEDDFAPSTLAMQLFNTGKILAPPPVQDNNDTLLGVSPSVAGKSVTGRLPQLLPIGRVFKRVPHPMNRYVTTFTEICRMVQIVEPGQCIVLRAHAVVTSVGYANPDVRFTDKTDPMNWIILADNGLASFLSEAFTSPDPNHVPTSNRELDFAYVWKVPSNVSGPRIIAFEIATGSMTLLEVCLMGA